MEVFMFLLGGRLYTWFEVLSRGRTHWSMFLLGGICFVVMGMLNEYAIPWHWCLLRQAIVSACIITVFEFLTGCIVNIWLGWDVWDYSDLPCNLFGQICIQFSALWILLSMVGIIFDDWIRYIAYLWLHKYFPKMKKRERPHYVLV